MIFRSPILIVDTETTGFPSHSWAAVVEIGAVLLDCDGSEAAVFESLIRPEVLDSRCDGALAVNKIRREDLAAADPAGVVAPRFLQWAGTVTPHPHWTTFNVAFDRPMMARSGIQTDRWATCVMLRAMDIMGPAGALVPTEPWDRRHDPARPWVFPKLSRAAEFFDVAVAGDAHRALTDARTAAGIAVAIRRRALAVAA